MKVRVIKRYVDRYSKKMCREGSLLEYEEERAEELIKGGYVEKTTDSEPKKESAKKASEEKRN